MEACTADRYTKEQLRKVIKSHNLRDYPGSDYFNRISSCASVGNPTFMVAPVHRWEHRL
jgi:hypothetical protein